MLKKNLIIVNHFLSSSGGDKEKNLVIVNNYSVECGGEVLMKKN